MNDKESKVRCFKMYAGHILVARSTKIIDSARNTIGYTLMNIRVLGVSPDQNGQLIMRILPYTLGAANVEELDKTSSELLAANFHLVYDPIPALVSAYIQEVSQIIVTLVPSTTNNNHH